MQVVLSHSFVPKVAVTLNVLRHLWRRSTSHGHCTIYYLHRLSPECSLMWIDTSIITLSTLRAPCKYGSPIFYSRVEYTNSNFTKSYVRGLRYQIIRKYLTRIAGQHTIIFLRYVIIDLLHGHSDLRPVLNLHVPKLRALPSRISGLFIIQACYIRFYY